MRPLVVLRPEPGATATCKAASEAGLRPVAVPLFEIEAVAWAAPDSAGFDGLLLTSANALRHAGPELEKLRGLPVYAVGEATAALARSAGFVTSFVGGAGVDELLADIDPNLRLLHLCGEQLREPAAPRQSITHLPVYRAAQLAEPDVAPIAGAVVAVHSPRAGARLAELAAACGLDASATVIAAISREAARAAGGGWERTVAADEQNDAALLALAARLCNSSARQ
jgi:uroporphyrinogen-III synthase